MITWKSTIKKIVIDIKFPDEKKYHKDIVLDYKGLGLTMEMIHEEDNGSWNSIDIDNHHFDIQFFGEDDCLAEDEYGDYNSRKAMTIPVHYQLGGCVYDDNDKCWRYNDVWVGKADGYIVRNVRVYTNNGMKKIYV